jgi:hypothetical protein
MRAFMRRMATDKLILCFILLMIIGIIVIVVCVAGLRLLSILLTHISDTRRKKKRIPARVLLQNNFCLFVK